jgi:hypothetical protein
MAKFHQSCVYYSRPRVSYPLVAHRTNSVAVTHTHTHTQRERERERERERARACLAHSLAVRAKQV